MDLCIDLETGATTPDAAILAIGAVIFDPYDPTQPLATLEIGISPEDNDRHDRRFSGSTLGWWSTQPEALSYLNTLQLVSLTQALKLLQSFIAKHAPVNIWANSPTFDVAILRNAYDRFDSTHFPFPHHRERDVRTLKALLPTQYRPPFTGTKHSALGDALHQTQLIQTAFRLLCIRT